MRSATSRRSTCSAGVSKEIHAERGSEVGGSAETTADSSAESRVNNEEARSQSDPNNAVIVEVPDAETHDVLSSTDFSQLLAGLLSHIIGSYFSPRVGPRAVVWVGTDPDSSGVKSWLGARTQLQRLGFDQWHKQSVFVSQ